MTAYDSSDQRTAPDTLCGSRAAVDCAPAASRMRRRCTALFGRRRPCRSLGFHGASAKRLRGKPPSLRSSLRMCVSILVRVRRPSAAASTNCPTLIPQSRAFRGPKPPRPHSTVSAEACGSFVAVRSYSLLRQSLSNSGSRGEALSRDGRLRVGSEMTGALPVARTPFMAV